MKVSPTPWLPLSPEEVSAHRQLDCPLYEECLLISGKKDWVGFTCIFCSMSNIGWTHQIGKEMIGNEDRENRKSV